MRLRTRVYAWEMAVYVSVPVCTRVYGCARVRDRIYACIRLFTRAYLCLRMGETFVRFRTRVYARDTTVHVSVPVCTLAYGCARVCDRVPAYTADYACVPVFT